MHVARSDFDAIATTSTAQEPAGAIIAIRASIWIPLDSFAVAATRSQTAVEMTRLWKSQIDFHSRLEIPLREIPTFPRATSFLLDQE
jgi:hypothetical protein